MKPARSPRAADLALLEQLGHAFAKHPTELRTQMARLRKFYAAVRDDQPSDGWCLRFAVRWLRILRVPPWDTFFDVRPSGAGCSRCEVRKVFTSMTFPGGSAARCDFCGEEWLVLH